MCEFLVRKPETAEKRFGFWRRLRETNAYRSFDCALPPQRATTARRGPRLAFARTPLRMTGSEMGDFFAGLKRPAPACWSRARDAEWRVQPGEIVVDLLLRFGRSMRRQPKRRASTDQAPGPSSARAAPIVAKKMHAHGSPGREMIFHSPRIATSDPEIGVHKPTSKNAPTAIASPSRAAGAVCNRVSP
jgi:hypothetical protein